MDLLNSLAEAKRQAGKHEGVVLFVTDKGRIRKQVEAWEKVVYKIEVKEGKQNVTNLTEEEKQKAGKSKAGKGKGESKKQSVPELPDTSDEVTG